MCKCLFWPLIIQSNYLIGMLLAHQLDVSKQLDLEYFEEIILLIIAPLHNGKVRGQIWTFLKLKLEVRWVLRNWGKTEAFRCFFTECKSVEIWLRYKHFSDPPNSKIIAGMLKNLAAHFCHCAVACRRRVIPFSVSPYKLDAIMECLRYRSAKSDAYFSFN